MIENNSGHDREELQQHADRVRTRLASTLETLDQRRRHFVDELDPKHIMQKNMPKLLAVGAVSVLSLLGGVIFTAVRARRRSKHMYRARWEAIARLWRHPERVGGGEKPSFTMEIGRRIVGALVGMALTAVSRRIGETRQLPPSRRAPG